MTKKFLLKLMIFVSLLVLIMNSLNRIFTLKEYPVGPNINILLNPYLLCEKQDGFYSLEKNSLDVLFVGSSNVHCNINPNVIWNENGVTSYDFSSDQQDIATSFYYLEQAFETQSPKVVLVDIMDKSQSIPIQTSAAHFAFDFMKNDIHKMAGIWNLTTDTRLELYFPMISYHDRWKELGKNDFKYKKYQHNPLNGAFIYMVQNSQEPPDYNRERPTVELPEKTLYWLERIRESCKRHNCECVFIKTPFAFYDENYFSYFDAVERYCKENNVPFLYLNRKVEEIGLDFSKDYTDIMHMNWWGSEKLSKYIGEYLQIEYNIPNKKGLPGYEQWDDDYDIMKYYLDNFGYLWK